MSPQKSSRSCMALYLQRHAPRLPPNGKRMELRKHGPQPKNGAWQIDRMPCTPSFLSDGAFVERVSSTGSASNFSKFIIRVNIPAFLCTKALNGPACMLLSQQGLHFHMIEYLRSYQPVWKMLRSNEAEKPRTCPRNVPSSRETQVTMTHVNRSN
jgi:hypothetical protein